jgi:hypothetical protein
VKVTRRCASAGWQLVNATTTATAKNAVEIKVKRTGLGSAAFGLAMLVAKRII